MIPAFCWSPIGSWCSAGGTWWRARGGCRWTVLTAGALSSSLLVAVVDAACAYLRRVLVVGFRAPHDPRHGQGPGGRRPAEVCLLGAGDMIGVDRFDDNFD